MKSSQNQNNSGTTTYTNTWDTMKTITRVKFIAVNAHIGKTEISKFNGKSQSLVNMKWKLLEGKNKLKIRMENNLFRFRK